MIILAIVIWWHSQAVRQEPAKLPFLSSILSATYHHKVYLVLYLVSTPLGNLKDITLRALEVLKEADLILCEDTRHSKVLLDHYDIKKPLKSYHKFNETAELEKILDLLKQGAKIALITDAGTPCIQDPGALLVSACHQHKVPMTALPGPSALTMALSLCGEIEGPFQFVGFFPKKQQTLKQALLSALEYEGHTCAYVSPHELLDVLEMLSSLEPNRDLFLTKELTKIHETMYVDTAQNLLGLLKEISIKGEFVLIIKKGQQINPYINLSPADHVEYLETTFNLSKKEALKLAAQQRGVSKRDLYSLLMRKESDPDTHH